MKGRTRSGSSTGRTEKSRVSPRCLTAKDKGDGTKGTSTSRKRNVFDSKKEKKRPALKFSDVESSEHLLVYSRRKSMSENNKDCNGHIFLKKNNVGCSQSTKGKRVDGKRKCSKPVKRREEAEICGEVLEEAGRGRKRNRLDVFEYNEDDGIDMKKVKEELLDIEEVKTGRSRRSGLKPVTSSVRRREARTGCSQSISVDKKKRVKFDETGNTVVGIKRETDCSNNKRCGMNKDRMFQTVDKQREKFRVPVDEPIRLSGSKGALRTMLNSKKQVGRPRNNCGYQEGEEHRKGLRLRDTVEGETHVHDSLCSKKKHKKAGSFSTPEKNQPNLPKISNKNRKACNLGTKASNTLSVMGKKTVDSVSITGRTRKRENINPPSKILSTAKHKKRELKRGIATEKQLIREQIKGMVLSAGWTIDYRPRRDKDYQDAVYVSPTGATYWSAVYAYVALRKQFDAEGCDSEPSAANFPFTPISDEILSKLTRKRRKNIEKEKKKIQINGNEGKIISLTKNGGKSLKVRTNEKSHVRREKRDCSKSQKSTHLTGVAYATGEILHQERGYLTGIIKKGPVKNQQQSFGSNARLVQGRKGREQTGCALLVRSSNNVENSDTDDFIPYNGKLTLLSWLIDSGSVPLSGKVQYKKRRCTRVMMEGQITRDGIHCDCCSEIITVSKFEIHAGSKLQQPFQNIYVETGNSLLKCQLDAWNKQEESKRTPFHFVDFNGDDPNDDTCGMCGDGGVLICCDGCPSTFHQSCLDMEMLPSGVWHCPNCSCKFCASTVDGDVMTSCPLLTCSLCQTKYHQSCVQEADARYGESNISCTFCGQKCGELFEKLQKLLGIKHELEAGFSWTLIQRTDVDSDSSSWELPQRVECNSKLAIALAVMDECFLPIIDRRSGINLIHNVVYNRGSNFSRLNYSGFYTVVLERGDEIISAASIRIHGTQLAEMPFIGTRHIYRRQGMFRRLLSAIEMALHSLNVEKLIIPAISELMHTWTVVFGFKPLEESHKQEMRSVNMLVFPGTGLLQKLLLKRECTEGNLTRITGVNPIGPRSNHQILLDVAKKSDTGSSAMLDFVSDEGVDLDNHVTNDEVAAEVSGLQEPHVSFQDNSDIMSNLLDAPHEAKLQVSNQGAICCKYEFQHEFTESATDTESPIHSGLSHDNNLEIRNDSVFHAHVEFNNQSSAAEGAVDDACEVNVEPDISFDENNTNREINGYTNDVSGPNNSVVDEGTVQFISCMNHHNDVERKSSVISHVVFSVVYPEENILHASDESAGTDVYKVRTESNAVEPGLNAGTESYGHRYTGITQSKVAPSINGFCGTDENNAWHDSEDSDRLFCDTEKNIQSHDRAASNDNFRGCGENMADHDSQILLKVPECLLDVTEVLQDTHEPKSEVASSECIPQAVREESVEHGCEVVSKSFFPTSNFIFPASAEVKSSKFLSKSCNDSPDVVELPISNSNSFHHGIHDVVDDSCDCKCILLDKHCSHLCGTSVYCTSNTTSESNFQDSNGFCDSES